MSAEAFDKLFLGLGCPLSVLIAQSPLRLTAYAYLMTSSARVSTLCGIVRTICLAALRFMISSNVFGCSTGRLAHPSLPYWSSQRS